MIKGFLIGIFCFLLFADVFRVYEETISSKYMPNGWDDKQYKIMKKEKPIVTSISSFLIEPSLGLYYPFSKRCVPTGKVIDGTKYRGRKYFKCNKMQIFISDLIY